MARDITTEPSGNILINTGYTVGQLAGGIHYESTATNISGAVGTLDFGSKSVLLHTVTGDLSGSYTFPPIGLPSLTQNATRAVLFIEYTQDATGGRAIPLDTLFANATSRWGNAAVDTAIGGKTRVKIIVKRIGGVLTYHVEFLPVHVHGNLAVDTTHSLTGGGALSQSRTLSLVNDTASPGNHKYYKTDGSGARGWHSLNIQDIDNVTVSSPASNQVLTYNGSIWVNAEPPEGGGGGVASEVVESQAALTAIAAPTNGMIVNVRGHTTANDGGGGVYMWVSTSTSTANGGSILEKNGGGTGRWFLQWQELVSVKVFGCKGDNSTDDQPALQLAVDAKVPLFLPRGTYLLKAPITWDPSNRALIMIGAGPGPNNQSRLADNRAGTPEEPLFHRAGRYMLQDGSWFNEIEVDPYSSIGYNQTFKNLHFTAGKGRLGHAMCLSGGKQTLIENCYFESTFRGLTCDKVTFDTTIKHCTFEGATMANYPWDGTTNGESNQTIAKRAWGLYVCSHKFVEGAVVSGYGTGIHAVGAGVKINGCRIEVNYYGMCLGGYQWEPLGGPGGQTSWPLERSFVGGCSFEANTIGLRIGDLRSSTMTGFGIQGSPSSGIRPAGEIGVLIEGLQNTSVVENGAVSGTFNKGGIVNNSRATLDRITAGGNVVSYAKASSPFGHTGTSKPFFRAIGYRLPEASITAFSDLQIPSLAGLNLRDGLTRSRNFGDVVTPTTGATTATVTFPTYQTPGTFAINAITTPTTTSTLAAGTYYYATTVLSKQAEMGINYSNATEHGHRIKTVAAGQGVQITFFGGTVSWLKRRIYRTKVGAEIGNFEGYWQQDSTSATFTDTGQAFTGRGMPPITGDLPSCEEDNTNYQIIATPSWATTVHVTNKATTGFTLNFGTAVPSGGTCAWLLFRP